MNPSRKLGANETFQRMLVQQRMAMRYFLAIFMPVFLVVTIDDLVHRNTVEFFANAAMTVILLIILFTRGKSLTPRSEHRVTSVLTLLLVCILAGITGILSILVDGHPFGVPTYAAESSTRTPSLNARPA
jgi:hypothetical protein